MYKVQLIPYEIEEVHPVANEIPDGVQMVHAPQYWIKTGNKGESVVVAVLDPGCTQQPITKNGGLNRTGTPLV